MALQTTVNQALTDALRAAPEYKAIELLGRAKLIKDIASYLSLEIGEVPMKARRLSQLQNSLYNHKKFIQTQNLNTSGSRAVIAATDPQYADAAAVLVDIQAANDAFVRFTQEIESVLTIARAANQIVDNDPTTGQVIEPTVDEADMTALRAYASVVMTALG